MQISITVAQPEHSGEILSMIQELAEYEKAADEVRINAELLKLYGFGKEKRFTCYLAFFGNSIAGMALVYPKFSTWKGPCLFLEDLIVRNEFRSKGIGTALMKHLIEIALEQKMQRLEWQVLDWNAPAISFYKKFGAEFDNQWITCKLKLSETLKAD